jgi:hypothetical protein
MGKSHHKYFILFRRITMKKKWIISMTVVSGLSLLALGIFLPFSTFQAATLPEAIGEQSTPMPWKATMAAVRQTQAALPTQTQMDLENQLDREKVALNNQQTRLEMASSFSGAAQEYINSQKNAGKDTTALENALSAFNQAIADAETPHGTAASLLASHAGFSDDGQVIDKIVARQTILSAGQALRDAHLKLTSGALNLRQAFQAYHHQS